MYARENGMAPAGVLVALADPCRRPLGWARTRQEPDWRFLTGLRVLIAAKRGLTGLQTNLRAIATLAGACWLWDVERMEGATLIAKIEGHGRPVPKLREFCARRVAVLRDEPHRISIQAIPWCGEANEEARQWLR